MTPDEAMTFSGIVILGVICTALVMVWINK